MAAEYYRNDQALFVIFLYRMKRKIYSYVKLKVNNWINLPSMFSRSDLRRYSVIYYLQAAEDGEQVVEGEHIAVHSHQTEQPGGTDEQKQQDGHTQSRATKMQ